MIIICSGRTVSIFRTRNIASTTPTLAQEGMTWHERCQLAAQVSPLRSSGNFICFYGCGKGLSIAAPCHEMLGISGFRVSANRMNPWGPLGSHLGFNRGSFTGAPPIGVEAMQPLGGGRCG